MRAVEALIILISLVAMASLVALLGEMLGERRRRRAVAALSPSEDVTKRVRPVLNVENRPLVEVLYRLGDIVEESGHTTADALRDVARVVQLAPEKVSDIARERLARVVEEHGAIVKTGAQHIREAGS